MFGDIGIGIILANVAHLTFNVPLSWTIVLISIVFTLLPDIDMLIFIFPSLEKIFVRHRGISHYPIVYSVPAILVWYFFGYIWASLFICGILIHLLHDTLWIGPGVQWGWPFSKKSYKFFEQDSKSIQKVHWVRYYYFQPTVVSVTEYGLFIISLLLLFFYS